MVEEEEEATPDAEPARRLVGAEHGLATELLLPCH
jgi:hypothetical protein